MHVSALHVTAHAAYAYVSSPAAATRFSIAFSVRWPWPTKGAIPDYSFLPLNQFLSKLSEPYPSGNTCLCQPLRAWWPQKVTIMIMTQLYSSHWFIHPFISSRSIYSAFTRMRQSSVCWRIALSETDEVSKQMRSREPAFQGRGRDSKHV